jgi:hypothetical protein
MISTHWELYDMVEKVITKLREKGDEEHAAKLDNALSSGCTGGEVLTDIGVELLALRRSEVALRLNLQREIDAGLEFLTAVLGPHR